MKLRNKKTGEIADVEIQVNCMVVTHQDGWIEQYYFDSIKDILEWEDYEEPKEYYAIDLQGDIIRWARHSWDEKTTNKIKEIGNYFETKEEAEKAVEKLKAWKRLKDKRFRFDGIEVFSEGLLEIDGVLSALKGADNAERLKIIDDLDLLFGGEE